MATVGSRYDGYADWYDERFGPLSEEESLLAEFLGPGEDSVCLDRVWDGEIRGSPVGYRILGVDVSADQLRHARPRAPLLVRADGASLPLRTQSVTTVVGFYFHTDVEDFAAITSEIARCLMPGGRFVYFGLHPCFIGAFVDRTDETDTQDLRFTSGYGDGGWAWPDFKDGSGLWVRVGGHHKTMAGFFNAFIDAGLSLDRVVELAGGGAILPRNVAIVTSKS